MEATLDLLLYAKNALILKKYYFDPEARNSLQEKDLSSPYFTPYGASIGLSQRLEGARGVGVCEFRKKGNGALSEEPRDNMGMNDPENDSASPPRLDRHSLEAHPARSALITTDVQVSAPRSTYIFIGGISMDSLNSITGSYDGADLLRRYVELS